MGGSVEEFTEKMSLRALKGWKVFLLSKAVDGKFFIK